MTLGNPNLKADNADRTRDANKFALRLRDTIRMFSDAGMSKVQMVQELNKLGVRTAKGGQWTVTQLQRVVRRLEAVEEV